jgi:hypothetical protein
MKIIIYIVFFAILIPTMSYGEEKHNHHQKNEKTVGVEALSEELRDLLSKEMVAIENGMMSIIPAYSSGNWEEIETTAEKIKNSYILKQRLTEDQIKELHSLLAPAFIEKDQEFHYLAGMLGHAAKNKKAELINFYFSRMNESCVNCHSKFATHRFPALSSKDEKAAHKH